MIGKYLNGYHDEDGEHIPLGWDEWYAKFTGQGGDNTYYDYSLSENGTVVSYGSGEQDYLTDVQTEEAKDFIRQSADGSQPLFMYLAPSAPHDKRINAPRHDGMFQGERAPRPPSFDETDVSDKPRWVQDLSRYSSNDEDIDRVYKKRLRMLQAVDDMVEAVVDELSATGRLDETYIFFTSDNGWHLFEHRVPWQKNAPYEESIRVPLAVRGPGIPAGRATDQMALNIDLAPTFGELGGAAIPSFVDGRSLRPTFASDASSWRTAFLEEFWYDDLVPEHAAVRTSRHKFVEYDTEEKELYDLSSDPYELESLHASVDPTLIESLKSRLEALTACAEESCRKAEDEP